MRLRAEKEGPTLVLDLEGDLDADGSVELEQRCLYEQQEGALHFAVGLGGVRRVTGPGLRVLLGLARTLPGAGGSLVLYQVDRTIEEALQVSGLAGSFERAADRAAALARSRQLGSSPRSAPAGGRAASEEKIDYAIELLGGGDPGGTG